MPVGTQAKLLRVLEDSRVRRLGGKNEIVVDVRIIASTNKNLEEALRKGELREDLYYRLNVFRSCCLRYANARVTSLCWWRP
jgi:transcriptional regulator with PAS, ATPase and Fis domain